MSCDPLPTTGLSLDVGLLLTLAVLSLLVGVAVLLLTRRRRTGVLAGLALVVLVSAPVVASPPPAHAASADCTTASNTLTVAQTSTMSGMGPGVAPKPIHGLVTNTAKDSTHVAEVTVAVTGVTPGDLTHPGSCDASDFVITQALMPVGRDLAPGASTPFAGASIALAHKNSNQDACKQAVVHLLYTANANDAAHPAH